MCVYLKFFYQECFNSPYGTQYFAEYAEEIPGESTNMLSSIAKETQCYVIGGSIPERDSGKLYNTSTSFGPDGTMLAKHRKVGNKLFPPEEAQEVGVGRRELVQLTKLETDSSQLVTT